MYYRIPLFLALLLSMRQLQMPLEGLSFVNTMAKLTAPYYNENLTGWFILLRPPPSPMYHGRGMSFCAHLRANST